MKKLSLFLVLLTFFLTFSFGDNGEQEEVDYLLFLPNSGNQFADEARAKTQLDNAARFFRTKNLQNAQIYVYGYAADVANDIDPAALSMERAIHVIGELQRRGISGNVFNDPVGYGSVNLWGNNVTEAGRSPNRRVRILFEDIVITPEVIEEAEPEIIAFELAEAELAEFKLDEAEITETEAAAASAIVSEETDSFNWWWLLLLLLPLLLLLWPKRKIKQPKRVLAPKPIHASTPVSAPVIAPEPAPASASAFESAPVTDAALIRPEGGEPKYYRLTEEEIRNLAYKLYEERNHQHGYDETDWFNALSILFAKYEAQGYIVLWP